MTKVYYFSGTGHSLAVAQYFATMLGTKALPIEEAGRDLMQPCQVAVVVFPVYCENVPQPVKGFLKNLAARNVVLVATYGKICYGDALYDAQKIVKGQVIAGAYVPMGHTYLRETDVGEFELLEPILERIHNPQGVILPKGKKHFFADLLPRWRSQIGVTIRRSSNCNDCNLCEKNCPMKAFDGGKINRKCIRCLRCVNQCPQKALEFDLHPMLKNYLKKEKKETTASSLSVYL